MSSTAREAAVRPKGRILVVEDEPSVLNLVVTVLRRGGYNVHGVERAHHAMALLDSQPFDLVLADVTLPGGISGIELGVRLRESKPNLAVLFMSGDVDPTMMATCGLPLLTKPFDLAQLRRAVDACFGED